MIYKISFNSDNRPEYRVLMDTMARVGDYCYSSRDFFLDTDKTFEEIKHIDELGNEYWEARELMSALEYSKWEHFTKAKQK